MHVDVVSIYLIDSSNMATSIHTLANLSLPKVTYLTFWFERQFEIVSFLLTIDDYNHI